jgi:hypothetical protein
MKLGLIQTRGIGDIIIALPIAKYFHVDGNEIFWPIAEEYLASFQEVVPWVNWIGVPKNAPDFFYQTPHDLLAERNVDKTITLYNFLSSHPDLPNALLHDALTFDQYKYAISNVPFSLKWSLADCLIRNPIREGNLFNKLVAQEKYIVIHEEGSNATKKFNLGDAQENGYQIIKISQITDNIFDWLKILEHAQGLALIDSVFANLVEQLNIGSNIPRFFGVRSNVFNTPVLLGKWIYV